jgi:integration host factor subunit alpha
MANALTKADIIEAIQKENGYSRKQSSEITEILMEIIKQSLESGEDVLISGFGKFQVKTKKERRGRNPATGEDLTLPPRKVVTFKSSGRLRDHINRV